MQKQLGAQPSNSKDAATKGYADLVAFKPYAAALSNAVQNTSCVLSTSATAPNSGWIYYEPYEVGPAGQTIKAIGAQCTTALSGTATYTVGLYADDGSGGQPNTNGGLIASGTITPTSLGSKWYTFPSPITLTPGRYWLAFLYYAASAPATPAQFTSIVTSIPVWVASGNSIGTIAKTHAVANQSAMANNTSLAMQPNGGSTAPVLACQIN